MESLQGQLLVASPQLRDPSFYHSVVLLVQHDSDGAMGVILNHPLETTVKSIWQQAAGTTCEIDEPLREGGPCEGPLMVIHTDEELGEIEVVPGVYWSTDRQSIQQLVSERAGPIRFFVGYAGWTAGQLENEIEQGGWVSVEATVPLVFGKDDVLWTTLNRAIQRANTMPYIKPEALPDDPDMN
jgi:putative transcriptional regulator